MDTHQDRSRGFFRQGRILEGIRAISKQSIIPVILALASLVAASIYIFASPSLIDDDAYIFCRYAENLVKLGRPVYNEGEISFGFTSLAWLLAVSATTLITGGNAVIAAKLSSLLFFTGDVLLFYLLLWRMTKKSAVISTIFTLLFIIDPFLFMFSLSGMETPLAVFIFLFILFLIQTNYSRKSYLTGLALGFAVLVRPDFLALFAAYIAFLFMVCRVEKRLNIGELLKSYALSALGLLTLVLPYSLYTYIHIRQFIPVTYVGKILSRKSFYLDLHWLKKIQFSFQANATLMSNLIEAPEYRYLGLLLFLFVAFAMLPVIDSLRRKKIHVLWFAYLSVLISWILFFVYYPETSWRYRILIFPTAYMSLAVSLCRSVIPACSGEDISGRRCGNGETGKICRILIYTFMGLMLVYWGYRSQRNYEIFAGEEQYEIIKTAVEWVEEKVPENEMIAFDMIGAFGYLIDRPVYDLGGLIDPEAWKILRNPDDQKLVNNFLRDKGVNYLLTYNRHFMWRNIADNAKEYELIDELKLNDGRDLFKLYRLKELPPLEQMQPEPSLPQRPKVESETVIAAPAEPETETDTAEETEPAKEMEEQKKRIVPRSID